MKESPVHEGIFDGTRAGATEFKIRGGRVTLALLERKAKAPKVPWWLNTAGPFWLVGFYCCLYISFWLGTDKITGMVYVTPRCVSYTWWVFGWLYSSGLSVALSCGMMGICHLPIYDVCWLFSPCGLCSCGN